MTAFLATTTQHVATITSLTRPLLVARAASFQASIQERTTNGHDKSKEENSCVVIRSAMSIQQRLNASDQLTNGGSTNYYQTLELNLVLVHMENHFP